MTNNDLLLTGGSARADEINEALAAPVLVTANGTYVTTGVLTGQQWLDLNGGQFHAQTVAPTDLVLAYTYAGDANLDGRITMDDYLQLDTGFLFGGTGWANGDFNHDGSVGVADYVLIDTNLAAGGNVVLAEQMQTLHASWFGASYGAAMEAVTAVPEPASRVVAGVGSDGLADAASAVSVRVFC